MTSSNYVWRQPPAVVLFDRASIAASVANFSAQGAFFYFILLGLGAHLLGKDLIYGLNIRILYTFALMAVEIESQY